MEPKGVIAKDPVVLPSQWKPHVNQTVLLNEEDLVNEKGSKLDSYFKEVILP